MRVAIIGAGSIAYGYAALLASLGHEAVLWSPSGKSAKALAAGAPLVSTGKLVGKFQVAVAPTAEAALDGAEAAIFALPANGHRMAIDAMAPHVTSSQTLIISSHMSLSGVYLAKRLAERGLAVPVVVWGTTLTAGRRTSDSSVNVSTVRSRVDSATIPVSLGRKGLDICQELFGDRFEERSDALAILLSNLNPQIHLGLALCNFTRMERSEDWGQSENTTAAVGQFLEALDEERLAIARAAGCKVRTIREHYHLSFQVEMSSVSDMARMIALRGPGARGPMNIQTRYVLEDVPFGLLPTVLLGRVTGRPATLHQAGIDILSALYRRDLAQDNNLLEAIGLGAMPLAELQTLVRDGPAAIRPAGSAEGSLAHGAAWQTGEGRETSSPARPPSIPDPELPDCDQPRS